VVGVAVASPRQIVEALPRCGWAFCNVKTGPIKMLAVVETASPRAGQTTIVAPQTELAISLPWTSVNSLNSAKIPKYDYFSRITA
jgi:hypothetical protein